MNFLGGISALIFAITAIILQWRRKKKTAALPLSPSPRSYNPFHYIKKETRSKYNPIVYFLCYFISYAALMQGIRATGMLFNLTRVGGQIMRMGGGVSYASGILVFTLIFLLLAKLFPGNGRPLEQLEFFMPAFALCHVFNRLGCFLGSGCCHGIPSAFGMVYPENAAASVHFGTGTPVFPNQLIESSVMLLLFALLLFLRARGKRTLHIFPLVFGATGFLLGFVMDHSHDQHFMPMFGFTHPTPFTHLLVFFLGIVFWLLVMRDKKKSRLVIPDEAATPKDMPDTE